MAVRAENAFTSVLVKWAAVAYKNYFESRPNHALKTKSNQ